MKGGETEVTHDKSGTDNSPADNGRFSLFEFSESNVH